MEEKLHHDEHNGYFTGQILLASPQMEDPRFDRAVIYVCGHDKNGAMGLIINKHIQEITFRELASQLAINADKLNYDFPVFFGGPVDGGRGFVLHTDDYIHPSTIKLTNNMAMTATMDILQAIAMGEGPEQLIVAMGYTGWGANQLESEINNNTWIRVEPSLDLIFKLPIEKKWDKAMRQMGLDIAMLDPHAGTA